MKIDNQISHAMHSAISSARGKAMHASMKSEEGIGNSPAAIFRHAGEEEYAGQSLNPVQRSILRVQEKIAEISSAEEMDGEEKSARLKTLQSQLQDLQKQLTENPTEPSNRKNDEKVGLVGAAGKVQEKAEEETSSVSAPAAMGDLIAMGAALLQTKAAGSMQVKAGAAANCMEEALSYAVNHPNEALRLTNQEGIESRKAEIGKARSAALSALDMASQAADAKAETAAYPADENAVQRTGEGNAVQPKQEEGVLASIQESQ